LISLLPEILGDGLGFPAWVAQQIADPLRPGWGMLAIQ
jgi:hypothetical protein